jgi:hypothetical protein
MHMLTYVVRSLVVAAAVAAPAWAVASSELAPAEMYSGRLAAVGAKAITVVVKQGDNLAFLVDDKCAITLDGKPASIGMLAVGHRVQLVAAERGSDHVATRIDAVSGE